MNASNNVGIWIGTSDEDLQLVARTGDVIKGRVLTRLPIFAFASGSQFEIMNQNDIMWVGNFGATKAVVLSRSRECEAKRYTRGHSQRGRRMETDRRSFLRAAGSSLVLGAGSVWSASAAAQAPASPVSFPGIPNPLEGGVDVIATGYIWTEGPVWVGGEEGHLLFSDVPGNAIYSWDGKRTTVFLAPSGYEGFPIPASLREAGSNGLALGRGGLLIADSGTRALARVTSPRVRRRCSSSPTKGNASTARTISWSPATAPCTSPILPSAWRACRSHRFGS